MAYSFARAAHASMFGLSLLACGGISSRALGGPGDSATADAGGVDGDLSADAGAQCAVVACGGELVGTWKITASCLEGSPSPLDTCPGTLVTFESFSASGALTFSADGTWQRDGVVTVTAQESFGSSCGSDALCSGYTSEFEAVAGVEQATCSTSSGACVCEYMQQVTSSNFGTYTSDGSGLAELYDQSAGTTRHDQYCVNGNTLTIGGLSVGAFTRLTLSR